MNEWHTDSNPSVPSLLTESDLSSGEVEPEGEQDVLNVLFSQRARELPVKKHPGQKDPTGKLLLQEVGQKERERERESF